MRRQHPLPPNNRTDQGLRHQAYEACIYEKCKKRLPHKGISGGLRLKACTVARASSKVNLLAARADLVPLRSPALVWIPCALTRALFGYFFLPVRFHRFRPPKIRNGTNRSNKSNRSKIEQVWAFRLVDQPVRIAWQLKLRLEMAVLTSSRLPRFCGPK